jgi:histidinol-phosphate aminotransferase
LAQSAALASLAADAELAERVADLVERRGRVEAALAGQGWRLPPSQANFVWLPTGPATAAAEAVLAEHGLTARAVAGEGVRVTIAEEESVAPLLAVAAAVRGQTA